jgi:hypothetical protein
MTSKKEVAPLPEDLRVFLTVIRKAGFAAAAEELGLSPAYVSKRIQILESTLATRLLHRTSRKVALTEDGERVQRWAVRILEDFQLLHDELSDAHSAPRGKLHLCSSFGFGRNHVAPAISKLAEAYPDLEVRLDLFDRVVDIVSEGFDLEIRVGDDIPGQHIGRQLVSNRRVLCAAPDYLARRGTPQQLTIWSSMIVWSSRSATTRSASGTSSVMACGKPCESAGRCRQTAARSSCNGRWTGEGCCSGRSGTSNLFWNKADWSRCCPSTPKAPTSGRCTRRGWPIQESYACAWSFCRRIFRGCLCRAVNLSCTSL